MKLLKLKVYLFNFFHPHGVKKCLYLDEKQTLKMIIDNDMSLIRWGDGETQFVYGKGIYFQDYDEDLKNDLISIITNKSQNVLKCTPVEYLEDNIISLILKGKLRVWSYTRYYFYKLLSEDKMYGDAFLFRPKSKLENSDIEKLWIDRKVIFVGPTEKVFKDFSEKYMNIDVIFIKIKNKNVYEDKKLLLEKIFKCITDNESSQIRVLITAGPTAKVLVHEITKKGYIAYDMGQYFTWKFYNQYSGKNI